MKKHAIKLLFGATGLIMTHSTAYAASEASAADNSAEADDSYGEIIVTAQKRAERLQDVPIAIAAIAGDQLASKGVASTLDLGNVVTGLTMSTSAMAVTPRVRGVGTAIAAAGNENSVSTYVDGVYFASPVASVFSLGNVKQVEVLKGPQGTLFGRNATGGLIQITTADPSHDPAIKGSLTVGNVDTIGSTLYATAGLSDSAAMDIAAQYNNQRGGFGINLFNSKPVGTSKNFAIRSKLLVDLTDRTSLRLSADYSKSRNSDPAYQPVIGSLPFLNPPAAGPYKGFSSNPFDINSNVQPRTEVESWGGSAKLTHSLGTVDLVSITAFREAHWRGDIDSEGTPLPTVDVLNFEISDRQWTQELQLVSTADGPFKWTVGGYFFDYSAGYDRIDFFFRLFGASVSAVSRQKTRSYAGYAQGTYKILRDTGLTLGIRYTDESKSFAALSSFGGPQFPTSDKTSYNKLTWRAALDHRFNRDLMMYASYNTGYKSGGYDIGSLPALNKFKPETIESFEVGLKAELFDRKLRLDLSGYHYNYQNIQLTSFQAGLPFDFNGDSAKIDGFDIDMVAKPVPALTINFGASVQKSKLGNFVYNAAVQNTSPPFGNSFALINAEGKSLPNAPEFTLSLGANYEIDTGVGVITPSANFYHSSRWYAQIDNRISQEPYNIVNASIDWQPSRTSPYRLSVWGRNLGNTKYAAQLFEGSIADTMQLAPGRTYGVTLSGSF